MIAALDPRFWWWVARSTGIVSWATAAAAVAWGLTVSGRLVRRRKLPAWLLDLHRYLGALTIAFVAVHLAALVADSSTVFGVRELLVPLASAWRPGAVAWGIVALYGLIVVQGTSWAMRALPRRLWQGIHLASYAVFVTATVHGALSGADRGNPMVQALGVAGVTVVLTLSILRLLAGRDADAARGAERAARIAAARRTVTAVPQPGARVREGTGAA